MLAMVVAAIADAIDFQQRQLQRLISEQETLQKQLVTPEKTEKPVNEIVNNTNRLNLESTQSTCKTLYSERDWRIINESRGRRY